MLLKWFKKQFSNKEISLVRIIDVQTGERKEVKTISTVEVVDGDTIPVNAIHAYTYDKDDNLIKTTYKKVYFLE